MPINQPSLQSSSLTGHCLSFSPPPPLPPPPLSLSLSLSLCLALSLSLSLSSGKAIGQDLCDPSEQYIFHDYDTSQVNGLCDIPSTGRISRCSRRNF